MKENIQIIVIHLAMKITTEVTKIDNLHSYYYTQIMTDFKFLW